MMGDRQLSTDYKTGHLLPRLKESPDAAGAYIAASLTDNIDSTESIALALQDVIEAYGLPIHVSMKGTSSVACWRPIETAPKDGTKILVFTHGGDYELSHWFTTDIDEFDPVEGTELYRKRIRKYYEGWNSNGFTHWMPLPDPPRVES